jgi:hypothetical protein
MDTLTLEDRVARLERSCRRWRTAGVLLAIAAAAVGAQKAIQPADARFGKITCRSLAIQDDATGGFLQASSGKDGASLRLFGPGGTTTVGITAQKDQATVLLSQLNPKGIPNAALSVDSESGAVSVGNSAGKSKEIEPE